LDLATRFAAGRLCLDFVNTRFLRRGADVDLIGGAEALRRWLRDAESVTGATLLPPAGADADGERWMRLLPRVRALRAALRALFDGVIEGGTAAPPDALAVLNAALRENPSYPQVVAAAAAEGGADAGMGFAEATALLHPEDAWLAAIARDAADLLCHGDRSRLRRCGAYPACIRLFYDGTRNQGRRWCVEKCGSAPKAAAYYRRKKARLGAAAVGED